MSQAHDFATPAGSPQASVFDDAVGASKRPPAPAAPPLASRRSPWIAAFLAFFPGLGSIYNGSYARGVAFFASALGGIHLANRGQELWGFAVAFLWFFNVIDAYREARLIRAGLAQDLGAARLRPATSVAEGLGLGSLLFLVGLVALLDVLGYNVEWVFDFWPVALMIAGAWFIAAAIRRMRAEREPEAPPAIDPPMVSGPPPHPPQGW